MIQTVASPSLTDAAVALIKRFETLRLDAYLDPVGVPTIGYGHTGGVRLGMSITPAQAEEFLRQDLNSAQADVLRNVKVPLNENEYGALVSLVFNIGGPAFSRSRCLALLNKGDRGGAADEFRRFVRGHIGGRAVTLRGLQLRREAERELFCSVGQILGSGDAALAAQSYPSALPAAAAIPATDLLPDSLDLRSARASLERLAAAAGIGTGLGAVPVLDGGSGQSLVNQAVSLWQNLGGPAVVSQIQAWAGPWFAKLSTFASQLLQAPATRAFLSQANSFLQAHNVVAIALGTVLIYFMGRMSLRVLRLF